MGQTTNNVNDIFQNYLAQFLNKQFKIVNLSGENVINNKFDELFEIKSDINFPNKVIESMTIQWFEEHNDKRYANFFEDYYKPEKCISMVSIDFESIFFFASPENLIT